MFFIFLIYYYFFVHPYKYSSLIKSTLLLLWFYFCSCFFSWTKFFFMIQIYCVLRFEKIIFSLKIAWTNLFFVLFLFVVKLFSIFIQSLLAWQDLMREGRKFLCFKWIWFCFNVCVFVVSVSQQNCRRSWLWLILTRDCRFGWLAN
jgi:hypothetical protein